MQNNINYQGDTRTGKDEWLTPKYITDALGAFDLDPCSPINRPWPTAARHYTIEDDGLNLPWAGRVWLNPPYGAASGPFLEKMAEHPEGGIALLFCRTETKIWFDHIWPHADALFFIKGRLKFCHVDGTPAAASAGVPSVLVAYGVENVKALQYCTLPGKFINLIYF